MLKEAEQGGFRKAQSIVRIVTRNGNSPLCHVQSHCVGPLSAHRVHCPIPLLFVLPRAHGCLSCHLF